MKRTVPFIFVALLAACGVDGAPVPPSEVEEEDRPRSGVIISGSVGVGVVGGSR